MKSSISFLLVVLLCCYYCGVALSKPSAGRNQKQKPSKRHVRPSPKPPKASPAHKLPSPSPVAIASPPPLPSPSSPSSQSLPSSPSPSLPSPPSSPSLPLSPAPPFLPSSPSSPSLPSPPSSPSLPLSPAPPFLPSSPSSPSLPSSPSPQLPTALEVLASNPDLSMILAVIQILNLTDDLANLRNSTILASTNEAFEPAIQMSKSLGFQMDIAAGLIDPLVLPLITTMVNLHLIPGRFVASDLVALATLDDPPVVRTLGDISTLTVDIQQSPGYITMAVTTAPTSHGKLVKTDILAENDIVIHIIDAVLNPLGY